MHCTVKSVLASQPPPSLSLRIGLARHVLPDTALLDSGKVMRLVEILRDAQKSGSRVLVFSQFTQVLDILGDVVEQLGHASLRIDGSTVTSSRQPIVDRYSRDTSILVLLLSTRAGGVGLNLMAAGRMRCSADLGTTNQLCEIPRPLLQTLLSSSTPTGAP